MIMTEQRNENNIDAFTGLALSLARLGPEFYARGWVLGTSGNFSAVVQAFHAQITAGHGRAGEKNDGMPKPCEFDAEVGNPRLGAADGALVRSLHREVDDGPVDEDDPQRR